jgi:murein DD-endopeptidase MepM/ murein hydrolase activator NlpD
MHTVESGDTLFGIALDYGVSVDALQEANGLDNPDALSIGMALIIPMGDVPEEESADFVPQDSLLLPTPTPLPLAVAGVARYSTAVGGLWCLGEIVNTSPEPVTSLLIQVTLVDGGGNRLATDTTLSAVDYLPPEQGAPFALLFREPPPDVADVEVALLRAEPVQQVRTGVVPLRVQDTEGAVSGPQYKVRGEIVNTTGDVVQRQSVVVTLYAEDGQVLAYRKAQLAEPETLAPGAAVEFSVLLTPRGEAAPASYQVVTWGYQAD